MRSTSRRSNPVRIFRGLTGLTAGLAMLAGMVVLLGAAPASADTYTPVRGVLTTNPLGTSTDKHRIEKQIIRSIYSAPRGSRIRVASWNIRDHAAVVALVRAHRRGVSVQVIMQSINSGYSDDVDPNNPIPAANEPNPDWWWLHRQLRQGNQNRKPGHRSWAKLCDLSCRGHRGLAHTKMYVFSQVFHSRYVVMYSSGNLTTAANAAQWNDMFTSVGRSGMWAFAMRRFGEMSNDRAMGNPWRVRSFSGVRFGTFPWYGAHTAGDPIGRVLNQVHCTGARAGTGDGHGHTVVKVAQTAIADTRGIALASKMRTLINRGCRVQVIYGLINPKSRALLGSHGHQMAIDYDGDMIYDKYLHMKVLTVSGVLGGNHGAHYTWNGSSNWVGYSLGSDEIFSRISSKAVMNTYNRFINAYFAHTPHSRYARTANGQQVDTDALARRAGVNPYAKFQMD